MAVSLQKKTIRGHPYWYARECQRVDGKPQIVWQKYLGRAEDIAAAMGAFSVPNRPPIPGQTGHPIRRNPSTVPEQTSHPAFVGLG